ncbi:MAG TPA: metallophosphoesterase [Cellvibrio sp.]|nr:metallophosphoesterase [Cellvibrio sp.]
MIIKYPKNTLGKDYICSDIHGHFHLLQAELEKIGFDERRDRLFSLGDLIDRGDESHLTLDWLAKPWFFAIQGNHERMLINTVETKSEMLFRQWMMWGGDWAEDLDFSGLHPYYAAFSQLPIAIQIQLDNENSVGLIHAELPDESDWDYISNLLLSVDPKKVESTLEVQDLLWSKRQPLMEPEKRSQIKEVKNIKHVFHGHTIVEGYLTIANRTFMDLGSYNTGKIGVICLSDFF